MRFPVKHVLLTLAVGFGIQTWAATVSYGCTLVSGKRKAMRLSVTTDGSLSTLSGEEIGLFKQGPMKKAFEGVIESRSHRWKRHAILEMTTGTPGISMGLSLSLRLEGKNEARLYTCGMNENLHVGDADWSVSIWDFKKGLDNCRWHGRSPRL